MDFWKNLHPLLRRAEIEDNRTANGAILHAIAESLTASEKKIILDKVQESFATTSGKYLNYWGKWFGLPRLDNETDDHYRNRIKEYLLLGRGTKPSIINAVRQFLQDTNAYISIYEPWKNIFILDKSKLDGVDHMVGDYYRYGVIDVSIGVPMTDEILKVIEAFKPAGVKVYTTYNPLMNKDNKITHLGVQQADTRTHIYLDMGSKDANGGIQLGLDDYNFTKLRLSKLKSFRLDSSKIDGSDILSSPNAQSHDADNLLLSTSENEKLYKNPYSQEAKAKPTVKYSFRGLINPNIRARLSLNFVNNAEVVIQSISSDEIVHNGSKLEGGFTQVTLSGVAPDRTTGVQVAIDNRTSFTDNLVKNSHKQFHNDGTEQFPISFDLAKDLGSSRIVTKIDFTVSNLKNTGYLAIVDGQDTDKWENLVPESIAAKPPNTSDKDSFVIDKSKLGSDDVLTRGSSDTKPTQPITDNGTYTYTLTTDKHPLKDKATSNRVFVKTNLDADIDIKIKLSTYSTNMDMNWSPYLNEEGYYNDYLIKSFKLASGDTPNLQWSPAPDEVEIVTPYYVDIINNTNVKLIENDVRKTKSYNVNGAKLSFAKLHNRNIALNTGVPIVKQDIEFIDKLYDLSMPIVKGKTYTVLLNFASNDVDKRKRLVISTGVTNEEVLNTPLYTAGDAKTYNGMFTAKADDNSKLLKLSIQNGSASDLYILNFKLGVD